MLLGGRGLLEEGDIQQSSYGGDWCIDWSVDHIQQMPVQTRSWTHNLSVFQLQVPTSYPNMS